MKGPENGRRSWTKCRGFSSIVEFEEAKPSGSFGHFACADQRPWLGRSQDGRSDLPVFPCRGVTISAAGMGSGSE